MCKELLETLSSSATRRPGEQNGLSWKCSTAQLLTGLKNMQEDLKKKSQPPERMRCQSQRLARCHASRLDYRLPILWLRRRTWASHDSDHSLRGVPCEAARGGAARSRRGACQRAPAAHGQSPCECQSAAQPVALSALKSWRVYVRYDLALSRMVGHKFKQELMR